VYGPTTAATHEEMERLYQDLSQAVKQVPKGDMLLVMGDFSAKVGRREPSAMSMDNIKTWTGLSVEESIRKET